MQVGSSAGAVTCAPTMRSSFRPFKDKRLRHEIRSVSEPPSASAARWCVSSNQPLFQVKKLQVMLRQANEQLERTMTDKQNLEDCVQAANTETAAKVANIFLLCLRLSTFLANSYIHSRLESQTCWKNCNNFHLVLLELKQISGGASLHLPSGSYDSTSCNFKQHKIKFLQFFNWCRI